MTVKEIARSERVHVQTVRQWIKLKKLKARQTVTGYDVLMSDLMKFKEEYRKNE